MKTIITSVLLLLTSLTYSQSNYQIADSTKEWNTVLSIIGPWGIHYCGGTRINYFGSEFYYNDKRCLWVRETTDSTYSDWEEFGFLREDTISKKVYYDEGLIYNFNINVGDSVYIDNHYMGFTDALLKCDSIDTVLVSGEYKKRFYFNSRLSGTAFDDIWIESIGSIYGLLFSGVYATTYSGSVSNLICCSRNDTVIYYDSSYFDCFMEDFYPIIISETFDTAYVGIEYEFQLLVDTSNADSFAIIGEIIPEGFSFNESNYLLTGIPDSAGLFSCGIRSFNYNLDFVVDFILEDIVVVLPTIDKENRMKMNIEIYPNPFQNKIFIENKKLAVFTLEIYNSSGLLMDKKIIDSKISKFDFEDYKSGLYLFKISDKNQKILRIEKLIKK